MIPSLLVVVILAQVPASATPAPSATPQPIATTTVIEATPAPAPTPGDASLENYRVPVDELTERMVGVASRAVRFDWRRKSYGFGLTASELLELNNFSSFRYGALYRTPLQNHFMGELALNYVRTRGGKSADELALTPYRQVGRPTRFEIDANVAYPIAEGVATSRPGFFPATELAFNAVGGIRYLYYPGTLDGAGVETTARSLFSPALSSREISRLEKSRPGAMQVDTARYDALGGLSLDVYFHAGGFFAPRGMVSIPVTGSALGFWWELSMSAGWMF